MIISVYGYQKSGNRQISGTCLFIGIITYTLVVGCRYDVGVDYLSYKSNFEHYGMAVARKNEIVWLYSLLHTLGLNYIIFFCILAFIQIFFFLQSFKARKEIITWGIFLWFSTLMFFLSMNVMRQTVAWCIFLFSIQYIERRDFFRYCVCMISALLFHQSALILIPIYFFAVKSIPNRNLTLICYLALFIIGAQLSNQVSGIMGSVASTIGYERYGNNMESLMETISFKPEKSLNIMRYFWLILNCCTIMLSDRLQSRFRSESFAIIYVLFLFGTFLDCIVSGTILERTTMYFSPFRIIVYSWMFHYLMKRKTIIGNLFVYGCIIGFIVIFIYSGVINGASGCYPFQFADINLI